LNYIRRVTTPLKDREVTLFFKMMLDLYKERAMQLEAELLDVKEENLIAQ